MKADLYINQGCIIDGVFSPNDHVFSLHAQLSSNLGMIIGPQKILEPQIENYFTKFNEHMQNGHQSQSTFDPNLLLKK